MTEMLSRMNDRELFCVLTGSRGIMAQARLRGIIRAYRSLGGPDASLSQMVQAVLAGQEKNAG